MNLYCTYVLHNTHVLLQIHSVCNIWTGFGEVWSLRVSSSMKLVWTKALLLRFRVHYHKMKTRLHRTTPLSWNKIRAITLPSIENSNGSLSSPQKHTHYLKIYLKMEYQCMKMKWTFHFYFLLLILSTLELHGTTKWEKEKLHFLQLKKLHHYFLSHFPTYYLDKSYL